MGITYVNRNCETCGNPFSLEIGESKRTGRRYRRFCSHHCSKIGDLNPKWKGSDAGEKSGRSRARRRFVDIGPCMKCGNDKSERHHIDENTLNNEPGNIAILCRRCHMESDGRLERFTAYAAAEAWKKGKSVVRVNQLAQTHCLNGHAFTSENTKLNPLGHRVCRACKKAASYKYWVTHKTQMLESQRQRRQHLNDGTGLCFEGRKNGI